MPEAHEGPLTSVSCGAPNRGALAGAVEMQREGLGYVMPEPWWQRGHRYGTQELVSLIERVAAKVALEHPGAMLGVGDLSAPEGGALRGHRSHQSGRDVDLIFYALTPEGEPFAPDHVMAYYGRSGLAKHAKAPEWTPEIPQRYFDLARNWALVKALMSDAEVGVQYIILSGRIRRWLIEYATRIGEPEELVTAAAKLMLDPPRGSESHNDHMHVRIGCSESDVLWGRCSGVVQQRRSGSGKWYSRIRCPARFEEVADVAPHGDAAPAPDSAAPDSAAAN